MEILGLVLLAVLAIICAAVLAAADVAYIAVSHSAIEEAVVEGKRGAAHAMTIIENMSTHMNVLTFVRHIYETCATLFIILAYDAVLDDPWKIGALGVLTASVAIFVIAGVPPRKIGHRRSTQVCLALSWIVRRQRQALGPIAGLLVWMGNMLTPSKVIREGPFFTEARLRDMVDRTETLDHAERDMLRGVFDLHQMRAHQAMVPRMDVVSVVRGTPLHKAMTLFLRSGFSRVPVIGEDIDDVIGVLYLKDIARLLHNDEKNTGARVEDCVRRVIFVPETKALDDLLGQMQLESTHVAVLVDEYGGTSGIITIEDIVEEIVGDIADEYDSSDEEIVEGEGGEYIVNTRTHISDVADFFNVRIEEDEVSTIGGLLAKDLGRVPIAGATTTRQGLQIIALPGQGRRHRITHVEIHRVETPEEKSETEEAGLETDSEQDASVANR